jgi:tetratricopeptide (TPR) repeat protein
MFMAAERFADARRSFGRALELQPGLAEARLNRAIANLREGRPREALPDLDALVEMAAPWTRIYFLRAAAREQCGDREGARADRAEGMRREPTDDISWVVRAEARLPGEPEKALADLDAALAVNPSCHQALQTKAHVLSEHLRRVPDAVACLDQLLGQRPDDLVARAGRGVLLARLGKRDAAHRDAARVARDAKSAGLLYQAACAYALTSAKQPNDADEAVRLLRRAFQQEPRWLDVAARDPDLAPLRGKGPFEDLLRRARAWYGAT